MYYRVPTKYLCHFLGGQKKEAPDTLLWHSAADHGDEYFDVRVHTY